jgi:hypothetical protein
MSGEIEKAPEWLDKVFLTRVLASYMNDTTVEVQSFKANTNFSEHFASSMFQCSIDFTTLKNGNSVPNVLEVVVKAEPVNDGIKNAIVSQGPLFPTEIKMYKETIPAINQLFERHGLKVDLAPE